MINLQDKIRGSLVGGAIGDALGYPVEFLSLSSIQKKYGENGITQFSLSHNGKALISDDTQMTLFTANGLLFGVTRWFTSDSVMGDLDSYVYYAYREWFETQIGTPIEEQRHYTCWLRKIPELNVERAPGNTCMSALSEYSQRYGVNNNSKGCGGVMRVAPVGLMAATYFNHFGEQKGRDWTSQRVAYLAGACAALTHKHPLGYISAAFHALLIYKLVLSENPITPSEFDHLCESSLAELPQLYAKPEEKTALEELQSIVRKALSLAESKESATTVIPYIGQGWVGEETVAIALYCAKKNLNNFEQAVIDAVNHDGDSDSTGSVCGNIMGAIVGYDAIPDYYKQNVELADIIVEIADDLNAICPLGGYVNPKDRTDMQNRWYNKYIKAQP
ncbi:MAG: ADP-ribosylglycohydrolase family protein [Paludibacteraceae bacterium]|nr:ADP-ribosylglycohydrolase family protein [Paludibacteraceae bacterium]